MNHHSERPSEISSADDGYSIKLIETARQIRLDALQEKPLAEEDQVITYDGHLVIGVKRAGQIYLENGKWMGIDNTYKSKQDETA